MTLDFVRVQYDTSANAIARGVLYLDVPWLSSDQLNDDKVHFNLPILLDGAVVTFTEMNIPIYLSSAIPNNFVMSVRTEDGTLVTSSSGLQRFTAQFSYNSVEG